MIIYCVSEMCSPLLRLLSSIFIFKWFVAFIITALLIKCADGPQTVFTVWLGPSCKHWCWKKMMLKIMSTVWPECSSPSVITSGFFLQMTAEALHRLVSDPVLPFYPLDIALDVQNKLKGRLSITREILDHEKRFKICQNVIQWERKKPELEGVMDRELAKSRLTLNAKCMKLCVSLNSHWLAIPALC